ncbi:MAG: NifB/NifX family molybdenum-iron cluster-binding protein [Campylobacterota bacterium]|nr:NifB/NifX family molybdenum-iron cluster-binding protein [Campylobacterota bacterium]
MIAIPVKTNKENPAVTTLFGKAKWFAYIDGEDVSIEKNDIMSGRAVVEYMVEKGVTKLVFNHMGGNPFMLLQKAKIECYHSGDERILLNDVIEKLIEESLVKVDGTNMGDFVEQGNMHNGGGNHDHNHDHHHDHNHNHSHNH